MAEEMGRPGGGTELRDGTEPAGGAELRDGTAPAGGAELRDGTEPAGGAELRDGTELGSNAQPGKPGSGAEPGTLRNPVKLTDPKMMRALAHPARIAIWTHIAMHGSATATECAEVAGLSPSACSYHLRALARYGFVEEDRASAADGRERPWRARLIAFTMKEGPDESAAWRLANRLLVENLRAEAEEIRARYLDRKYEYPADWRAASGEMFSVAHVTPEELDEMRAKVLDVMAPYVRLNKAERSPGALGVRIMFDTFPWFGPEEATRASQRDAAPTGLTSDTPASQRARHGLD